LIGAAVAVLAMAVPAVAQAHVTVQPNEVPAGGFTRLDVRVPNEQDDAATNKVEVKMPDGFVEASYEPIAGWKVEVAKKKLAKPIVTDDGKVDSQVSTITWTATDPAVAVQPGQFRDFGLSVGMPANDKEGDVLTFPAIQTYDNGDVVRWIGPPDAEEPAPQVTLTAATDEHGASHADSEGEDSSSTSSASVAGGDDDSGAPTWLAVLALVVGGLGLIAGGSSLLARRRS
jgi:uncharacterized protein YcnI